MADFLQLGIGAIVWLVANVVYVDKKRKGLRGLTRFAAFWAGTPTTWITLFALKDGQQPSFEHSSDDDDDLLDAIRRDRALRGESASEGASETL